MTKETLMCCEATCEKPAEWEIVHGASYDDVTHSCEGHVWEMLTDAKKHWGHSLTDGQRYVITRELGKNRNMLRNTPSTIRFKSK